MPAREPVITNSRAGEKDILTAEYHDPAKKGLNGLAMAIPNWIQYPAFYLTICLVVVVWVRVKANSCHEDFALSVPFTLLVILFSFIGSRVYGAIVDWRLYFIHGEGALSILWGGRSGSFGAFIGGLTGAWIVARSMRVTVLKVLDFLAPMVPVAMVIGRIGCLVSGCCFGAPADIPWAVTYGPGSIPYLHQRAAGLIPFGSEHALPVHPSPIYDAAAALAAMFLMVVLKGKNPATRSRFIVFLLFYSAFRVLVEFTRGDSQLRFGFNGRQALYTLLAAGAAAAAWLRSWRPNNFVRIPKALSWDD